jgi:molybdate transport system substrate-binding protein
MLRSFLVALFLMTAINAHAVDLQVIAGGGIAGPLKEIAPAFQQASGHTLTIRFAATPELIKMATSETPVDVAVVPREVFLDAGAKKRFILEVVGDVASVGFGVAVKEGAPRPDISTPDAFKEAMLNAGTIATVPASAAGAQVLKTFERLDIAEAMKPKIQPQASPADIPQALIDGKADLGIFLMNVLSVPGVTVVGPFPAELQQEFVFQSAVAATTRNAFAAKTFTDYLRSPAAVAILSAHGMTPAQVSENRAACGSAC